MGVSGFDVVTGAFSYSGRAITTALLASGRRVRTLTGHPDRAPSGSPIEVHPLDFDDPAALRASLEGAETLFNTYWVRFAHGATDHDLAVANSRTLFQAASQAGVRRVVHVSITHPSTTSAFAYFRGKALVEEALARSGVAHSVLRPAILFGGDGVLINNIAWLLRRLPVFFVGGRGDYRVRAVHVDDLAQLALEQATASGDRTIDAVGPDRPTFVELVVWIRDAVGARSAIYRMPGQLLVMTSTLLGYLLHDVLLTRDEYFAMAEGLADTDGPATGATRLSEWLVENSSQLGLRYANELDRHFKR
jgi:NADH dehydrogenase